MKYIIEHLEEGISEWCEIEYKHISSFVGKENLIFTNVTDPEDKERLKDLGRVEEKPARELGYVRCCILDPQAEDILTPHDANAFDFLIFGGILGDYPPKKRTEEELSAKMQDTPKRNLGDIQMATDTAVLCAKMIIYGIPFEEIPFTYDIEIELSEGESVQLPYRYIVQDGKPLLAPGLVEYLQKEDSF